jgi:hypothetical protein
VSKKNVVMPSSTAKLLLPGIKPCEARAVRLKFIRLEMLSMNGRLQLVE